MEDQKNRISWMKKNVKTFPFEKEMMKGRIINEVHKTEGSIDVSLLRMSKVYPSPLKLQGDHFY